MELGLIGGMFVLFIYVWIELGLSLFTQAALDGAVRKESRLIRTGVITASGQSAFVANLCADMVGLVPCSAFQINVASGASFASLSGALPTNGNNQLTTTGFNPGGSGQDVIVQVGYTRAVYFPVVGSLLAKGGNLLVVSTIAFQNEPF